MLCVSCTHEQLAAGCSRCLRHWCHGGVNAGGNHGRYINQRLRNDYGYRPRAFGSAVEACPPVVFPKRQASADFLLPSLRDTTVDYGRWRRHLLSVCPESLQDILGALLVLLVRRHVNAFMMMLPPNYWATPGTIFPLALIGAGAFGMGLISNSAIATGPLASSALVPNIG